MPVSVRDPTRSVMSWSAKATPRQVDGRGDRAGALGGEHDVAVEVPTEQLHDTAVGGQHHRRHRRPTGHPPSPDLGCLSQTAVEASHLVHEPKVPSNSSASTLLRLGASFPERRSTDLDRGLWALFGSAGERASGRTMPMLLRGEVGGDGVGGVAVEVVAGAVVAACGARVGVAGGILDVTERGAGVEGGGYEGVA
jgi:hypothetical protein